MSRTSVKCPLDLVKVLDILAGDGSVYLGDDVTVTHSHLQPNLSDKISASKVTNLIEISVLPLFSFLFGFIEILFAVFHLRQTLLMMGSSACAAALNHQTWQWRFGTETEKYKKFNTEQENKGPDCGDCPGHPTFRNRVQDLNIFVNNPVNFYSLPHPVQDERFLNKVVCGRHQNSSAIEWGSKYCETFLQERIF